MGNPKAFLEIPRQEAGYRPIHDRIHDFGEVEQTLNTHQRREQASRCMDCGVPFCHWACPLGNKAPEWNDALYKGDWELAFRLLTSTNPFPEFTGRICPALCEKACVLNRFNHEPTTNREDEAAIIEAAFREGYIRPRTDIKRIMKPAATVSAGSATAPATAATVPAGSPAGPEVPVRVPVRVAVIGAGPAGLACADALNQMGYTVTVFEKAEAAGGLLRYGIPNFKLNKAIIDRRLRLLEQEGIEFRYGEAVQCAEALPQLTERFDAVVIATGTPTARDLPIPGRNMKGVHFALELLAQQNRVLAGMEFPKDERITAKGKHVLVIGGGDTGSDCIGTAHRQGALSVTQIEIMPRPVEGPEDPQNPWPEWPRTLKTTSSHEEGCTRRWNINTLAFLSAADLATETAGRSAETTDRSAEIAVPTAVPAEATAEAAVPASEATVPAGSPAGPSDRVAAVRIQPIDWKPNPAGGRPLMVEAGEPEIIKAELVLLAMGFLKPNHPQYPENVFITGDAANGASLVVRAMASGRDTAKKVAAFLQHRS